VGQLTRRGLDPVDVVTWNQRHEARGDQENQADRNRRIHGACILVGQARDNFERIDGMRPVTLAFTEGNLSSITQGLSPGEIVVIDGQDKLQPGSHVEVRSGGPGQKAGQPSELGQ